LKCVLAMPPGYRFGQETFFADSILIGGSMQSESKFNGYLVVARVCCWVRAMLNQGNESKGAVKRRLARRKVSH
jgi:hypothetical protein